MANPERGEVDLVAGERTYILFLSTNALCAMEKRMGKSYGQILSSIMALDVTSLRAMTHAVLQSRHGKEFASEESAGTLIDKSGMKRVKDAMVELFTLNTPPDEEKKASGSGNPQQSADAEDGTGDNSALTLVATG